MGIGAHIHTTFQLLSGWLALSHWLRARTEEAVVAGVDFVLAIFVSGMLQESGHERTARNSSHETRANTLLRIGGAARLERVPKEPEQELRVALAIPAVNGVIAAALFVWLQAKNGLEPLPNLGVAPGSFLEWLMVTTVMLALFNPILAFAMDGGRVLRAMLASRMKYTRPVQITEMNGPGMAFLLTLQGLFLNPSLLFNDYECHSLSVKRNGRLAGVLTAENLREFLMMQVALGGRRMERAATV